MPPDLAGVALAGMTLEVVDDFLAGEAEETLYWEAKGDGLAPLHKDSVRKAVAGFANSERGGYLFVGAERAGVGYAFPGLNSPPPGELGTWLDDTLGNGGVSPLPRVAIRVFQTRPGAAIVAVDPVREPPCVTISGGLYVRTNGRTVPVTDPTEVARLYRAGRSRRLGDGIARLDEVIAAGIALRTRLMGNPPDPDNADAAEVQIQGWIRQVAAVLVEYAPGMAQGVLFIRPGMGAHVGPMWRSGYVGALDSRIKSLADLQQSLFSATL